MFSLEDYFPLWEDAAFKNTFCYDTKQELPYLHSDTDRPTHSFGFNSLAFAAAPKLKGEKEKNPNQTEKPMNLNIQPVSFMSKHTCLG